METRLPRSPGKTSLVAAIALALGATLVPVAAASPSVAANLGTASPTAVPVSNQVTAMEATTTETTVTPRAVAVRKTKKGAKGQRLTVTPTKGFSPYGQTVTIKGRGFSELVGIYVGLCVRPKRGAKPTPCGGGADQDGSSGSSAWISSNPPPYGRGLAIPYKPGGRFTVTIKVSPRIGSYDCRQVRCAIVARADHLRASDRSWDVVVPVTFR